MSNGDKIKVISAQGELLAPLMVSEALPQGLLYMPISFPTSPVYELFASIIDHQAKAPALKSCAVKLERITDDS